MSNKFTIGWQKYEDLIEKQLDSPILNILFAKIHEKTKSMEEDYEEGEEYEEYEESTTSHQSMMPISPQLIEDMTMLSNFDCWIGHTNFNITKDIQNKLDCVDGVELLKICSRYRFFIGVGRMFNFQNVRKNIEEIIIPKGG